MYLKTFGVCVSISIYAWPSWFFSVPALVWRAALKMAKVRLDLLTDIDMWLMVEKYQWWNKSYYKESHTLVCES